jgi:ATP-dependent exoDNAse (exonuclease V) beta subunit
MYVAATRARRTLWLSAAPERGADGTLRPDRRSPLAVLWPALAARFETVECAAAPAAAPPRAQLQRLGASWRPAEPPPAVPLTRLPGAYFALEPPEFSWVGATQREIGTLVHARLARLAQQQQLPSAGSIGEEGAAALAELARAGVPERERGRAAELVVSAILKTLADERGRWILSAAHAQAHSEWELSGVSGGRLRNVKIDRSFIDEHGTRWVIDYKTSVHEGGGLEEFLDHEMQRYQGQLASYCDLARALGPQPVRAALYFPLLGAFRELR